MKKLINKIKSWFFKREPTDTIYIYAKCDEIAEQYGTRCSSISINKLYYPHSGDTTVVVYLHTLKKDCKSIYFDSEIDLEKILATWELMLISSYGKVKNM